MFPDKINGKVVAISDLHGDYAQARLLLNYLEENGHLKDRFLVFLGDYCDVGPDTSKVIDLLLKVQATHPMTAALGNHDLNLAKALGLVESPHREFYWNRLPTRNAQTLRSYGAKDGHELLAKMPNSHKRFLVDLPWFVDHPDYLFIHCGFDPHEPLEDQLHLLRQRDTTIFKPKWLHNDRLAFIDHRHQTDKTIIAGHTILPDVTTCGNKILIDTGAGYGGVLTALLLPEMEVIQTARSAFN